MNEWIKCSDRLPDVEECVLAFGMDETANPISPSYYAAWIERFGLGNNPIWQYSWCCGCYCGVKITHWMSLPEAINE